MTWCIVIPEASPSQNKTDRMHFRARIRLKKKWGMSLLCCARGITKASTKRILRVTRHGKQQLDPGNLIGGLKGIIDEFVKFGWLVDDSPEWLELHAVNGYYDSAAGPRTVILLEDV